MPELPDGVRVTALRFLGTIRNFVVINPLAGTPAAKKATEIVSRHLASALAR